MKNTILILSLFFLFISLSAQSNSSPENLGQFRLKLGTEFSTNIEGIWKFRNAPLIPAIQFRAKKGDLHQLELLHLSGNVQLESAPIQTDGFSWAVRYEYAYPLLSEEVSSWMPYVGLGFMNAHNAWLLDEVVGLGAVPRQSLNLSQLSLVPIAQFQIDERFFIDFSLPLVLMSLERNKVVEVEQVTIIDRIQTTNRETSVDFFTQMGLRFGIGIKL